MLKPFAIEDIEEGEFLLLKGGDCHAIGVKQDGQILFLWQSLETIEFFAYLAAI